MTNITRGHLLRSASQILTSVICVIGAIAVGIVTAILVEPSIHSRYFLWVSGRALGLSAFTSLWLLVILGTWMRHPLRERFRLGHPESRLRLHSALASATLALLAGHICTLAMDRYAGVGWKGVIIPGAATYRPVAITFGIFGLLTFVIVMCSGAFAGRRGTRHWLVVHRLGALNFAIVWIHGVLAGTDTATLRVFYVVTGSLWTALLATRAGTKSQIVATQPTALTSVTRLSSERARFRSSR